MTEYKTHPALQTDNYVRATTLVPDKYGIIQLSNDLLVAMHEADMSSLKDDTTEDVSQNVSVLDNFTQLTDAMEDLAKDMGKKVEAPKINSVNDPYGLFDQLLEALEETDKEVKHEKAKEFMNSFLDYMSDTGD
ncbi:hypothetical protein [Weissella paramesenteroides]|jgi:hypothetical protein|uniref:hypothetical protein n=1 Tax=Weissella paramesenteroides TaxID=1249 RepID=UPI002E7B9C9E|nr:hypothetical protein [Weissella paramesenteroides]WPQ68395.1 hypothetical protein QRX23_02015 [Weissella paramesenteroides]